MEKKTSLHPVTAGIMDRWALMDEGRKLHDRAVFEIFAGLFARLGFTNSERRRERRSPGLTPSLAGHRAR